MTEMRSSDVRSVVRADLGHLARRLAGPLDEATGELRDFAVFVEEEYYMRAYADEVWIVPASTSPLWPDGLSFLDTHVKHRIYYRADRRWARPLYIALRYDGQVKAIQKVLRVEFERRPVELVPLLREVPDPWPSVPHTIWHLGEPVSLPRPLKTGPSVYQRSVSCDVIDLFTCTTVREIEQRRSAARTEAPREQTDRIQVRDIIAR